MLNCRIKLNEPASGHRARDISQFSLSRGYVRLCVIGAVLLIALFAAGTQSFLLVNLRLNDFADLRISTIRNASITGNAIAQV
jgi:hypothetical protein